MTGHVEHKSIRNRAAVFTGCALLVMGLLSWLVAQNLTGRIEENTRTIVEHAIPVKDMGWLSAKVDGMQVLLSGKAPDEMSRVRVTEAVVKKINSTRVVNGIEAPDASLAAPQVRLEIVQNDKMSSIVGLLPKEPSPLGLYRAMDRAKPLLTTLNLVEDTGADPGKNWEAQLVFMSEVVSVIPSVKISAYPGVVAVEAVAQTEEVAAGLRKKLTEVTPDGVKLTLDISSPRVLITPFAFSLRKDDGKIELISCAASNHEDVIAIRAGMPNPDEFKTDDCKIGIGAPTEKWGALIAKILSKVASFDRFGVDVVDNQITVLLSDQMSEPDREAVIKELRGSLPVGFGIKSKVMLTKRSMADVKSDGGEVKLSLKKSAQGDLQVQGVVGSDASVENLQGFAVAKFGTEHVKFDVRSVDDLPPNWEKNSFAALQAIAEMETGDAVVTDKQLLIEGVALSHEQISIITKVLTDEPVDVQVEQNIKLNASEEQADDAMSAADNTAPTAPLDCVENMSALLKSTPIQFEKNSVKISPSSAEVIKKIANALSQCGELSFEIGGHTDAKGGDAINLKLSEGRAKSVLDAILALGLAHEKLSSKGYGSSAPIASNDTEEGRAQNRRIEIRLNKPAGEE